MVSWASTCPGFGRVVLHTRGILLNRKLNYSASVVEWIRHAPPKGVNVGSIPTGSAGPTSLVGGPSKGPPSDVNRLNCGGNPDATPNKDRFISKQPLSMTQHAADP